MLQQTNNKSEFIISTTFYVLMYFVFLAFMLLDKFRLQQSVIWAKTPQISSTDLERISQFQDFASMLEIMFFILYFIVITLSFYFTKKSKLTLTKILVTNICFWCIIFISSYSFSAIFSHPIGNLLQITYFPILFIIVLLVFGSFSQLKTYFNKKRKTANFR